MIAVVCVYVGWVRSMCGEVYIAGVPGEVGNRDTFSAVIICIMDLKKKKKKSCMSVYYHQFNGF